MSTSSAHQAARRSASVRAANTVAGIAFTVAFAFARVTGDTILGVSVFFGIGASGMLAPGTSGSLHNLDEAKTGNETDPRTERDGAEGQSGFLHVAQTRRQSFLHSR